MDQRVCTEPWNSVTQLENFTFLDRSAIGQVSLAHSQYFESPRLYPGSAHDGVDPFRVDDSTLYVQTASEHCDQWQFLAPRFASLRHPEGLVPMQDATVDLSMSKLTPDFTSSLGNIQAALNVDSSVAFAYEKVEFDGSKSLLYPVSLRLYRVKRHAVALKPILWALPMLEIMPLVPPPLVSLVVVRLLGRVREPKPQSPVVAEKSPDTSVEFKNVLLEGLHQRPTTIITFSPTLDRSLLHANSADAPFVHRMISDAIGSIERRLADGSERLTFFRVFEQLLDADRLIDESLPGPGSMGLKFALTSRYYYDCMNGLYDICLWN
ncbi:hypothetical protein PQX77_012522 [Marasmius sp. AFHP31]|nr:hypothetical protein PQX77_012522 [Marasmius sp. AFHP31]